MERQFEKEHSVFRDWKEDNMYTYKRCFENDMNHWKALKIKFKVEDLDETIELLEANYSEIKEIITWLQSKSQDYPYVSMLDLGKFIKSCDILDKEVDSARIDTLYLNASIDQLNKKQPMVRWSFVEFVIRLAKEKFMKSIPKDQEHPLTASMRLLLDT